MFQQDENYCALPSKVAQLVLQQSADAWKSFFDALNAYDEDRSKFTGRPSPPGYSNGRNLVKFHKQALGKRKFNCGFIVPSMSPIKIPVKPGLKFADLCEVRIVPKAGCFVIEIVYELPEHSNYFCSLNPSLAAAIDIGLDNLATIVFNDTSIQTLIINGKPLKSANQFYNKQLARFKGILPNKRGPSLRIKNIVRNRNNFFDSYLHQCSRMMVDEFLKQGVTQVSIGKNEQWKTSLNLGKRSNQNFTQIPHARFIEILTYKLEKVGIKVIVTEESYTSKASALDWDIIPTFDSDNKVKHKFSGKRVTRAWYVSKEGVKIHADVNGALNIGRKSNPERFGCLKLILRDRGCLVVHPRRITPVFKRAHAKIGVAQSRVK